MKLSCARQPARDLKEKPAPFADLKNKGRDERGRFAPGNALALKHGMRAQADTLAQQLDAAAALAERQAEIEQDLGGEANLSRVHRDAIRDLLRLEMVGDFLFDRLVRQGPLTSRDKARAGLTVYMAVIDRLTRLRQMVGLERRAKRVDPLEAIHRAVEAANRTRPEGQP